MTDPTPNRPPLWEVMAGAWSSRVIALRPNAERLAIAAELRAIAQWIRERHALPNAANTYIGANVVAAELLAEADRVEAGERIAP